MPLESFQIAAVRISISFLCQFKEVSGNKMIE